MSEALCYLSVAELGEQLRTRRLSPVEVTRAHLERITSLDAQTNAYITVCADHALAQAAIAEREIASGVDRGPLHGIPFGLKDMFETRGILTTAHSRVLQHNVPGADAFVVRRLYDAGAILLGKHASHEFAHGGPSFDLPWPPARNPWNTAHYTGSSSTGSAAAVAGGLASFALGTDTGGSVRTPAWMCGIVGFKPTFGLVGRSGVIPFSSSCDHVGPLTRTVRDSALVLQAIAGPDPGDPGSSDVALPDLVAGLRTELRGVRLGVLRHHFEEDARANAELRTSFDAALDVLRDLGAVVEDVRVRSLHDYYAMRIMLTESELFARHQEHLRSRAGDYGHHFLGRALAASLFTSADYIAAQRLRRLVIEEMRPLYERFDALLTTGAGPAPRLDAHRSIGAQQKWSTPSMGTMFSLTGAPALALPCGFSASGLPLGMQIAGRPFEDAAVLAIGHAYEQASGWFARHPRLDANAPARAATEEHAASPDAHQDAPVDPATREQVMTAVRHAGLHLDEQQLALLYESAPHAIAMARKLPRNLLENAEQAAVFRLEPQRTQGAHA